MAVVADCPKDIFSFNVEQARDEPHNMVAVVMADKGLTVQEAIEFVGDLCLACVDRFENDLYLLPSWGPEIDRDIVKYVDGLQNWMAGNSITPSRRAVFPNRIPQATSIGLSVPRGISVNKARKSRNTAKSNFSQRRQIEFLHATRN